MTDQKKNPNVDLLMPLMKRIESEMVAKQGPYVIAIDGRAASGKSTLGILSSVYLQGELIYLDHFFLPPGLRTEERLNEPGGNIHYERFIEQVLPNLKKEKDFSYQIFNCSFMRFLKTQEVKGSKLYVVEGSYSQHPRFGDYADLKLFLTVPYEEQLRRIQKRNGSESLESYKKYWIPMEEHYFETFKIAEKADEVISLISEA